MKTNPKLYKADITRCRGAFIVWQGYKKWASDKEKYAAWNEIIANSLVLLAVRRTAPIE